MSPGAKSAAWLGAAAAFAALAGWSAHAMGPGPLSSLSSLSSLSADPRPAPPAQGGTQRERVERAALMAAGMASIVVDEAQPERGGKWSAKVRMPGRDGERSCRMLFSFAPAAGSAPQLESMDCQAAGAAKAAPKAEPLTP